MLARGEVRHAGRGRYWNEEDFGALAHDVAGTALSELVDEDEEAKRFDLLMLRLQLALLRADPDFEQWRDQVRAIAALLEEKAICPNGTRADAADSGDAVGCLVG